MRLVENLLVGLLVVTFLSLGAYFANNSKAYGQNEPVIVLTSKNSYTLRGEVTVVSVGKVERALFDISARLKQSDIIYLVLDTPGGDVEAGLMLVDAIHGLPQKVKTITIHAYSMGFHIAQNLDERLILPNGVMMSHRVKAGLQGQVPGELNSRLAELMRLIARLDGIAAKRMNLTVPAYQELIRDELWVSGEDAVKQKAADRVVNIRCAIDLAGTEKIEVPTVFGVVMVEVSKCPLIPAGF